MKARRKERTRGESSPPREPRSARFAPQGAKPGTRFAPQGAELGTALGFLSAGFARGFVATGLLAAVQDRAARRGQGGESRRVLRLALQGGTALAAGSVTAEALAARDWALAASAVAAGSLGVLAIERLLQDPTFKEMSDGQEET